MITKKQLTDLIDKEVEWCLAHAPEYPSDEFKKGIKVGLTRAFTMTYGMEGEL